MNRKLTLRLAWVVSNIGRRVPDIECRVRFERLRRSSRHILNVNVFDRDKLEVIDVVRRKKELCSRKPLIAYCKLSRLAELDVVKKGSRPAIESLL